MSFNSRLRSFLDVIATIAIIATCSVLLWSKLFQSNQATASQPVDLPLPTEPLAISDAATKGSKNASLAMVVYAEFQCPYCASFARDTLPQIDAKYVRPGKLLLAFRHFPLEHIHPFARRASESAICAGIQGKFWEMHDSLFENPKQLDEASLTGRAIDLGLDVAQFSGCLSGKVADRVRRDVEEGRKFYVSGTPTVFLGTLQSDGRVKVSERVNGAAPFKQFESVLDSLLVQRSSAR